MSKVLPILFNGDMVRAILDGRKTVTRRCVKPEGANPDTLIIEYWRLVWLPVFGI